MSQCLSRREKLVNSPKNAKEGGGAGVLKVVFKRARRDRKAKNVGRIGVRRKLEGKQEQLNPKYG